MKKIHYYSKLFTSLLNRAGKVDVVGVEAQRELELAPVHRREVRVVPAAAGVRGDLQERHRHARGADDHHRARYLVALRRFFPAASAAPK